jgi:guanine deaminase
MSEDPHAAHLREAVRIAAENVRAGRGGPFGALVAKDGAVVGRGTNLVTSTDDPTAHAEIVAIRDACRRLGSFQLAGCDVYTSSEPCPMCLAALYWARPDRVFYANGREEAAEAGFDDQFIYRELERPPGARSLRLRKVDVPGAREPFRLWLAKEDRIEY